jgi:hypothetical protein
VKRTQLYLDDDIWQNLKTRARITNTTISELARTALREKYGVDRQGRKAAFEAVIGLWKDRNDLGDTEQYVRRLRSGTRLKRLAR